MERFDAWMEKQRAKGQRVWGLFGVLSVRGVVGEWAVSKGCLHDAP